MEITHWKSNLKALGSVEPNQAWESSLGGTGLLNSSLGWNGMMRMEDFTSSLSVLICFVYTFPMSRHAY